MATIKDIKQGIGVTSVLCDKCLIPKEACKYSQSMVTKVEKVTKEFESEPFRPIEYECDYYKPDHGCYPFGKASDIQGWNSKILDEGDAPNTTLSKEEIEELLRGVSDGECRKEDLVDVQPK